MAAFVSSEKLVQESPKLVEVVLILDSAADVPASGAGYAPGSLAIVADKNGKKFMLNASGVWKEL